VLAELAKVTDRRVLVHGMMLSSIEAYREAGVSMLQVEPATERPRGTSFAGELVLAPLSARGTPWIRRLGEMSDAFASGLMRVRGVRRQRAFDRGFVLSDHADWPALIQTVTETGASQVLATHGHAEPLARELAREGWQTGIIRTAWEGEPTGD
jgi:putative mRNA 3-end processing factor